MEGEGVAGGSEEGEVPLRLEEGDSDGEGLCHLVDGAEGDAVVAVGEGFRAGGVHLGVREGEGADGFTKEGGFFVLRLGESDGELGAEDGDGQPGEAGAGAEVEEGGDAVGEGAGGEDGLEEVAAEDAFFITDGGEIGAGVPLLEEGEVGGELVQLLGGQRRAAGLFEELVEAVGHRKF